jgi:hypothetical protein
MTLWRPFGTPMVFGFLIFGLIALTLFSLTPHARLRASLCKAHGETQQLRFWLLIGSTGMVFTGLAIILVAGFGVFPNDFDLLMLPLLLLGVGVLCFYGAVIHYFAIARPVTVFRQQGNYCWLSGVPGSYLESLPDINEAGTGQRRSAFL